MVTFYTLAYILLILLVLFRSGQKSMMYIRLFLLILSYSLLITIIWITTYRNEKQHYIFAAIIFISNLLFQLITLISFYNYVIRKKTLIGQDIIQLLIVILLLLILLKSLYSNLYRQLFASFENVTVASMGSIILALGYI